MLQKVRHGRDAAEQIIAMARSNANLVCRPLKCATFLTTPTCGQHDREATDKASDWLTVTTVSTLSQEPITWLSVLESNQGKWAYIFNSRGARPRKKSFRSTHSTVEV